jgi:hypothetical protein
MAHRFELFEQFCLPSIQNQTNKNFKWLILMDRRTSAEDRERMCHYKQQFGNIQLVFTTAECLSRDVQNSIKENGERDYIITTRIDNDDAYHKEAIDMVQHHFSAQEFEFVNFSRGYQYSTKSRRLYLHEDMSSPFMSLVEKWSEAPKTVQCEAHNLIKGKWPLRQIVHGRYWLQVIHDRNAANNLRSARLDWFGYNLLYAIRFPDKLLDLLKSVFRKRGTLKEFNVRS